MARKLNSFIDGFMKYTDGRGSPYLYRKWAAIFTVSAACERKVWLRTAKGQLFPNQYITLVGGAGIGKSLCTNTVHTLLKTISTPESPLFVAPSSVTKASLIDSLAAAERKVIRPMETPSVNSFNSLTIIPNELGVFLPAWDGEFMSVLTDLWDCNHYSETRRTSKISIDLPHTQLSMFSATTPAYLMGFLPEGAWEQGFMSRMLLVYSGESTHTDLFLELDNDDGLFDQLTHDLRNIYKKWGQMEVADDAKEAINAWAKSGGEPRPDHPKLTHYCARRAAHLLKLCMVASLASSDELFVTLDHFAEALDWLTELEKYMPDIFKSMKTGGDGRAIEECWHFAYGLWIKDRKPIPEHRIVTFLQERVPAHNVLRILDVMERSGLLKKQFADKGGTAYEPKARKP